jgi:hypothetical protein
MAGGLEAAVTVLKRRWRRLRAADSHIRRERRERSFQLGSSNAKKWGLTDLASYSIIGV